MTETLLWKRLRPAFVDNGFRVARHEDAVTPGIPDVSYTCTEGHGWLELKSTGPTWGKAPNFKEFRPSQLLWLNERYAVCPAGLHFLVYVLKEGCWLISPHAARLAMEAHPTEKGAVMRKHSAGPFTDLHQIPKHLKEELRLWRRM